MDCLPLDDKSLLLFLLWQRQLRAWRVEWVSRPDLKKVRVRCAQEPALTVVADLQEPFIVYGSPARLFLVTESGKLYACRDADKGGQALKLVWQDGRRPIRAVIGDAASGRAFAFAPAPAGPGLAGPSVYFELAEKVDPVPYDPVALGALKREEPLKAVLAYARLLLADKKIAP